MNRNKNVRLLLLSLISLSLSVLTTDAWGAVAGDQIHAAKDKIVRNHDANAWLIKTTNYGPFVYPENDNSGGYWGGPGHNYIYGAGLWVGAINMLDSANVSVGYNPGGAGSEFGPVNPYTWDWTNWSTDSASRVYISTDPADLAAWPLRDAGNNPVIKSIQDGYATYSDENPAFTFAGETPIGIRIRQSSYAWNTGLNNDVVYFRFTVINASGGLLSNVYAGPCFDADIGNESGASANDRTDFDYARNLAIQYQTVSESGWPSVGQLGCRLLQSPVNNTGSTVHVIDNQFSHDIAPGSPLGLTSFKLLTIDFDPSTDTSRYYTMQGYNYKTMAMDAYDEHGEMESDKIFLMCSGPFNLAAGDSVIVTLCVMAAADRNALLALSDSVQAFYDSQMGVAGGKSRTATPAFNSPRITIGPNPFLENTEISYQIATQELAVLSIYNQLGQKVRTLVGQQLGPGQHTVQWNGCNDAGQKLSAGVYLLRLQSGNKALAKKVVLLR